MPMVMRAGQRLHQGGVAGDPIWTQCRMVKAHSHGDGSPFIAYATASCDPTEVMVSHAIGYGAAQGCVDNSNAGVKIINIEPKYCV